MTMEDCPSIVKTFLLNEILLSVKYISHCKREGIIG